MESRVPVTVTNWDSSQLSALNVKDEGLTVASPVSELEILITTDEETGMTGAMALQPQHLSGKIVLNLDSEEEGKLWVSCAGGIRTQSTLPIKWINKKEKLRMETGQQ